MPIYIKKYQPIQYINKIPYLIYATFPIDSMGDVSDMKKYLGVDTAFKHLKQGVYFFCNQIKEIEFEEIE